MIYITGDTHGDLDRFKSKEMRALKKGDTLIICGDFGFVWDGSEKEARALQWLSKRRYNILFVDGAHDNANLLSKYPQAQWQGGQVRELGGKLRLACRGEIFDIEGKKVFTFGGDAGDESSGDVGEEDSGAPTQQEIDRARHNLEKYGFEIDYIVTHRPSRKICQFLLMDHSSANILDAFLDEVREKCKYECWFFGSIHKNKRIPPHEMALFTDIVSAAAKLQ